MKKVRSVLTMAQPKPSESLALRDGLPLQLEKEVAINLMSVTGYYFALRVLAHAWTYLVQVDSQSFLFMDLSSALHYCNKAFKDTMEFSNGSLFWLQRNDSPTRGKMASALWILHCMRCTWSGDHTICSPSGQDP